VESFPRDKEETEEAPAKVRQLSNYSEIVKMDFPDEDYFFAFFLLAALASARRSVFLRRAARFLTLSLPWLLPIRPYPHPFPAGSK
jgi:hypothetical protein